MRLYIPAGGGSGAALLWVHGGGYVIDDVVQDDAFCSETARELGIVVVSANYRLAPEHPFPAALDDILAAWQWLRESAGLLGVDQERIAVGGSSAGAGLAACLAQRLHDAGGTRPPGSGCSLRCSTTGPPRVANSTWCGTGCGTTPRTGPVGAPTSASSPAVRAHP